VAKTHSLMAGTIFKRNLTAKKFFKNKLKTKIINRDKFEDDLKNIF